MRKTLFDKFNITVRWFSYNPMWKIAYYRDTRTLFIDLWSYQIQIGTNTTA